MTEAFNGLSSFRRVVDDFVIYDSKLSDHIAHVKEFLKCCSNVVPTNTLQCCQFFQTETTFAGFLLSDQGYQVDPAITDAIARYPVPTNRTELRSFVGLVNQLSSSTNAVASLLTPFRALLSTKNEFTWSSCRDTAFTAAKASLTTQPTLTLLSQLDSVPMPVAKDWGTYFNSFTGTLGPWSRQDPDSFQMLSLAMQPLSLNYLRSRGQSLNVEYSWQASSTSWL